MELIIILLLAGIAAWLGYWIFNNWLAVIALVLVALFVLGPAIAPFIAYSLTGPCPNGQVRQGIFCMTPPPPVVVNPTPTAVPAAPAVPTTPPVAAPPVAAPAVNVPQPAAAPAGSQQPNFAGGSWNRGTSETVTADTKTPILTGKAAFGDTPIDIPAGKAVVFEGFELGLGGEQNKKTGPGIQVVKGPYKGTMWVHDGQVWPTVDLGEVPGVIENIRSGWANRKPALNVNFCLGC